MLWVLLACQAPRQEAVLLAGWDYGWETLSHRISLLDVGVNQDHTMNLGFIGGPFSSGVSMTDTPLYRMRLEKVSSPDLWFAEGMVETVVGPEGEGEQTSVVTTVDASEFGKVDGMVALLTGFRIATRVEQDAEYPMDVYDPSYGYTTAGFGFSLGTPTGEGQVSVPVDILMRWRPQDREDMNAAIPYARTDIQVRFLLVGYKGELQMAELKGDQYFPVSDADPPWAWTEQSAMSEKVEFSGEEARSVVGWNAFELGVNLSGDFEGTGDYVREMGMELVPTADDQGSWDGNAVATVKTTSAIELTALSASYTGRLARLGVADAEVVHYGIEGTHPVGEAYTGTLF